jgi:hypothetical protein
LTAYRATEIPNQEALWITAKLVERRILPAHFSVVRNLLVPVWGVAVSLYLVYAAFFRPSGQRRSAPGEASSLHALPCLRWNWPLPSGCGFSGAIFFRRRPRARWM